ncbi:MAG: hypothetical protein ACQGVC_20695 [Myxococcota bacterium]
MGKRTKGNGRELVGRDLARVRLAGGGPTSRPLAALLVGALVAGMGLAALRIDILRLRYALADAIETEKALLEDQRVWTAKKESLRDPKRLAELARERGFARPTHVIDLRPVEVAAGRRP